jgi:large subunit ribosomal protein L18
MATTRGASRLKRKQRNTVKGTGTAERARLCVFRSNKFTYAQLINDEVNQVIASASTKGGDAKSAKSVEAAKNLGVKIAELAKQKNVTKVVFDRNGYIYHGRIAAVAEGARQGGLDF